MLVIGLSLLLLVILFLSGVPIAFGFMSAVLFLVLVLGYDPQFLLPYSLKRMHSLVLLALPLFIIAGGIMERGNITEPLVNFVDTLVSRVKGGIGAVGIIATAIFGAISGSSAAAIACLGPIMIPRLEKEGYPRGYATSLMTASAGLANLIPPSILMILYGWISLTSVTACFLAGVFPGILLMGIFVFINWIMVGKYPVKKPRPWGSVKKVGKEAIHTGWRALPALLMPVLILGSIYGGIATPTEAAAVAAIYAIPVGFFIYRGLTPKRLGSNLLKSGTIIGSIMIMLFFAMMLGRIFIMEKIPDQLTTFILGVSDNYYIVLLMCNVIVIILGMFIDDLSCMLITVSLLFPIVTKIGVNPIHFSAILTTNIMMGCYTPPMAPMIYIGQRIGGVTFPEMFKTSMMLVVFGYMPVLVITTYWPQLSLWLPKMILGARVVGLS